MSDPEQEYEDIQLDEHGVPLFQPSPTHRPPIPLPGFHGKENAYSTAGGRSQPVKRSQSLQYSVPAPPLPPPNRNMSSKVSSRLASDPTASPRLYKKLPPQPPGSDSPVLPEKSRSNTVNGAPPVPPRPAKIMDFDELKEALSPKPKRRPPSDFTLDVEELTLAEFVSKHRHEFPLRVRVCKGFYGQSERTSVSEGDTFNIHFVKNSKVVNMCDRTGFQFKVSLNSALEFGVLHDPNNNMSEATEGFTFDKVSDLLLAKVRPKVVRALSGWRGNSLESTIDVNELLIIKGVKRTLNGKFLKAYNPYTNLKKELPENCSGQFSTRPYDVKLFLPEITEHLSTPIPCSAMLFVHSETAHELPSSMITSVVKLQSMSTETSLIATSTAVEDYSDAQMIDIPFDLDIEVQIMRPIKEEATEQLYADTRDLLENFDPSRVQVYLSHDEGSEGGAQSAVYTIVREEHKMIGMDIEKPSNIYSNLATILSNKSKSPTKRTPRTKRKPLPSTTDSLDESVHEDTEARFQAFEERLQGIEQTLHKLEELMKFESEMTKLSHDVTSAKAEMKRVELRVAKSAEELGGLKTQVTKLVPDIDQLRKLCNGLQKDMNQFQQRTDHNGSTSNSDGHSYMPVKESQLVEASVYASSGPSQATIEENKHFLASMDYLQILQLLEALGLKTYEEVFMKERITGEILLECDDEVLRNELMVTSKIHRVKLIKVISGRYSPQQILRGEDPYVYACLK